MYLSYRKQAAANKGTPSIVLIAPILRLQIAMGTMAGGMSQNGKLLSTPKKYTYIDTSVKGEAC